ncbi:Ypt/Rab-GAP domain of gyp1p superfamily protein [Striga asiatica]|uniref:Ypt/Rab-GAP domain of gyp1p superfamily protein n=1 Tax=Striga asiatica TaxID=4170 RepID=A0A5A7R0P2_STRAF|nr:Ypt/Rab-GAP domain of gyp1p superfamily protein [Striga asiatica]
MANTSTGQTHTHTHNRKTNELKEIYPLDISSDSISAVVHLAHKHLHARVAIPGLLERVLEPPLDTVRHHFRQRRPPQTLRTLRRLHRPRGQPHLMGLGSPPCGFGRGWGSRFGYGSDMGGLGRPAVGGIDEASRLVMERVSVEKVAIGLKSSWKETCQTTCSQERSLHGVD